MLPLLGIATSLISEFAPTLIGKITGSDKAEEVAENVVGIAKSVTGQDDPEKAVNILKTNPEIALKFQKELHTYELTKIQEETKRLQIVNSTMQAEATSGKGIQAFWRPFNGILFGITLFCDYFISQIVLAISDPQFFTWQHIPGNVYSLWAMVLGVAAGSRGVEKVAKTKKYAEANGIGLTKKDILKEFGKGILGNM